MKKMQKYDIILGVRSNQNGYGNRNAQKAIGLTNKRTSFDILLQII